MLHTKFQFKAFDQLVSERKSFIVFFQYMGIVAILVM